MAPETTNGHRAARIASCAPRYGDVRRRAPPAMGRVERGGGWGERHEGPRLARLRRAPGVVIASSSAALAMMSGRPWTAPLADRSALQSASAASWKGTPIGRVAMRGHGVRASSIRQLGRGHRVEGRAQCLEQPFADSHRPSASRQGNLGRLGRCFSEIPAAPTTRCRCSRPPASGRANRQLRRTTRDGRVERRHGRRGIAKRARPPVAAKRLWCATNVRFSHGRPPNVGRRRRGTHE